jgi:hypothetical protein
LLEQAITGYVSINMADANVTLTNLNGAVDQARNAVIELTGTNSAVRDVIPPVVEKLYTIVNNTTGGFAIRVIGATGTGVNIPNGATALVYCNGTNFVSGLSGTGGNFFVNGILSAATNVSATSFLLGNNATVTNTITATTANATTFNGTNFKTTNFTITESGGVLQFKYGATVIMSINSTGNLTSAANITAYGTP